MGMLEMLHAGLASFLCRACAGLFLWQVLTCMPSPAGRKPGILTPRNHTIRHLDPDEMKKQNLTSIRYSAEIASRLDGERQNETEFVDEVFGGYLLQ